jgi:hypothetical protein
MPIGNKWLRNNLELDQARKTQNGTRRERLREIKTGEYGASGG